MKKEYSNGKIEISGENIRKSSGGASTKTSFRTGKHKSAKDYDRKKKKQELRKELDQI